MEKFKAKLINNNVKTDGFILFKEDYLIMNSLEEETILKIFYKDIEEIDYNSGVLKFSCIDSLNFKLLCNDDVLETLKRHKSKLKIEKHNSNQNSAGAKGKWKKPLIILIVCAFIVTLMLMINKELDNYEKTLEENNAELRAKENADKCVKEIRKKYNSPNCGEAKKSLNTKGEYVFNYTCSHVSIRIIGNEYTYWSNYGPRKGKCVVKFADGTESYAWEE